MSGEGDIVRGFRLVMCKSLVKAGMVSADIQWQIIRKTSSFLRRQRGIPKHFSRERFNLKGVNSIRFNGLVHQKGLDIQAEPDGKGIEVAMKKRGKTSHPTKSTVSVTLKKNSRKSLKSVANIARSYRNVNKKLAQKRASQLLRSLKPVTSRRGRHVRKAEV
ncbi:unnamed protein product [Onchocerca ochengi]|uniref:Large ribosomal subunit protein eL28 n=2 Tax=Onchocerca TaxID=6281 RepID=A0A182ECJ8_ONCOC|nr:unnamed protein product [Onchocerca ochengi]